VPPLTAETALQQRRLRMAQARRKLRLAEKAREDACGDDPGQCD